MNGELTVTSWVRVDAGCPVRYFEFLKAGNEALREMDALFDQEEAERQRPEQG